MSSKRVQSLQPSLTLKIAAKAKEKKNQGIPVIDFSVGEPDFPTPDAVKHAGMEAITANFTRYTQTDGTPSLKKAILKRLIEDDGVEYKPEEIIISPGAKASIYLALAALLNDHDEVIIPSPYWVSYPEQVRLNGGTPVFVETTERNGFRLGIESFLEKITRKTKAVIINNPSNPTGAAYPPQELAEILEVALAHNIYVISDEIYSKIIYDQFKFERAIKINPNLKSLIITIDGASKVYSMTGWRIGFAAGPREIIKAMSDIQGHLTSNPCSISQAAAEAAYAGDQSEILDRAHVFQERRDYILERLKTIHGVTCYKPEGAFYLFPNVSKLYGKSCNGIVIKDSLSMSEYLLEKANVATVPGIGFGADHYIRISFATSMADIQEGMTRIEHAIANLS